MSSDGSSRARLWLWWRHAWCGACQPRARARVLRDFQAATVQEPACACDVTSVRACQGPEFGGLPADCVRRLPAYASCVPQPLPRRSLPGTASSRSLTAASSPLPCQAVGSPAALHGFEIKARRRFSVGFSSSSLLSYGPRDVQLWIYCRGAGSSNRLFAAAAAASSSSSSSAAATSSSFLTLFGDGYSWVDNTDYVVIA